MKTLLASLILALVSVSASASVTKGQKFDSYHIRTDENQPVTVKFSTVYETSDSCNHFGLSGSVRKVEIPEGTQTVQQDFVADFSVYGTEMACPPMKGTRKIALESEEFVIQPAYGRIWATILVPASFKLSVK
jgi:hypothetical protein